MKGTVPYRFSRDDASKRIRHCLEEGQVIPSRHFRDKLEVLNVSMVEAFYILKHGRIWNEPEFDVRYQQWNYRIEGTEPDGEHLAIVFTFVEAASGLLITVFLIDN